MPRAGVARHWAVTRGGATCCASVSALAFGKSITIQTLGKDKDGCVPPGSADESTERPLSGVERDCVRDSRTVARSGLSRSEFI
jgi:hypothetical protein